MGERGRMGEEQGGAVVNKKKSMTDVFKELSMFPRKIILLSLENIRSDSRYTIAEVGSDYVKIQLLGDDELYLNFTQIASVRVLRDQITIRY